MPRPLEGWREGARRMYSCASGAILGLGLLLLAAVSAGGQNLVLNGNFEGGNRNFSNDYVYAPTDMGPEGRYCVVKDPRLVHGNWTSIGDHTSGTGLMLVVNGDFNPTNVVWRQTVTVQPKTHYLFSAWAASSHPINPGRFSFFVNGVQQGSVQQLPGISGAWQNFAVLWESGEGGPTKLEIKVLTTVRLGNDFVLDDLSFRSAALTTPAPPTSIERAVAIRWPTMTNRLYQPQWASGVEATQWHALGMLVVGDGTTNVIYDSERGASNRYYRVLGVR
jgi:hypothetical protein